MYKLKQIPEDFIVEEIPSFDFKGEGEYTYLLLEKKDYNTEIIIQSLSKIFKIPRKKFGYAGVKDRRAITKQYISVKGKIKDYVSKDFTVKVVGQGTKPISLGDLLGNKFIINIRNIEKIPIKKDFMINYFDEQRFGRKNSQIAFNILKCDFKKAAYMIEDNNVEMHLKETPNDFVGAIRKLPFKILKLYMHSAQSLLWNEVAAQYVKNHCKEISEIEYKLGKFIFSQEYIENIKLPLVSFDTEFVNDEIEELFENVLKKNDLSLRNFIIRQIPDITPLGGERDLVTDIKDLTIGKLEEDELNRNKKKCKVEFVLGKGSYATLAIKSMLGY